MQHRQLYHQLLNIATYPEALAEARSCLRAVSEEASDLLSQHYSQHPDTALTADGYEFARIDKQLHQDYLDILHRFDEYKARVGPQQTEYIPDRDYARWWFKQIAPVKCVDGSWYTHVFWDAKGAELTRQNAQQNRLQSVYRGSTLNRFFETMPACGGDDVERKCQLRDILHPLFVTLAEELGSGKFNQNHVTVYRNACNSLDAPLPPTESPEFIADSEVHDESFAPAVVQLCLSHFSGEHLPEVIGYNLGYEMLPLHLLLTVHDLDILGVDSYYFLLHVTIDNAASGHAAMARHGVDKYLRFVEQHWGRNVMLEHWRRVLIGYFMNDVNPSAPIIDAERKRHLAARKQQEYPSPPLEAHMPKLTRDAVDVADSAEPSNAERRMIDLLSQKAPFAHMIHDQGSHIGDQSLRTWLDPERYPSSSAAPDAKPVDPTHVRRFLHVLAHSSFIVPGNADASPFLTQLCAFGGCMFAIFTRAERRIIRDWINTLPQDEPAQVDTPPESPPSSPVHQHSVAERMRDLIASKRKSGSKRHARILLPQPDGTRRGLDTFWDDPVGMMAALRSSEYTAVFASGCPFARSNAVALPAGHPPQHRSASLLKSLYGGSMTRYFTAAEKDVVSEWVAAGCPLPQETDAAPLSEPEEPRQSTPLTSWFKSAAESLASTIVTAVNLGTSEDTAPKLPVEDEDESPAADMIDFDFVGLSSRITKAEDTAQAYRDSQTFLSATKPSYSLSSALADVSALSPAECAALLDAFTCLLEPTGFAQTHYKRSGLALFDVYARLCGVVPDDEDGDDDRVGGAEASLQTQLDRLRLVNTDISANIHRAVCYVLSLSLHFEQYFADGTVTQTVDWFKRHFGELCQGAGINDVAFYQM
ncbi:hypothetical protein RI367_004663 [Sorochytrium milnesiophthora]